ncbi:MAG: hypothetical protein IPP14_12560 [Planctomycetes bacterium]|nr:hypothetical protein [Planctomycetota bacterium]
MPNFFQMLFGSGLDLRKLKLKLREIERERRKYFLELRKLSASQTDLIEKIKGARREGNQFEVDYLWEELKAMKHDFAFSKRAAKVSNLEGIALKRYIRGLERLEKRKDKDGVNKLLQRIRSSGLDAKLALQSIDEAAYLDELNATLDDLGLEIEHDMSDEDPEKERFLSEIDTINEAEGAGNFEDALKTEAQLKQKLESEDAGRA